MEPDQMPLFNEPNGIAAEFLSFDALHPEIYDAFCHTVEQLWAAGCRRFGSQGVFWVVRWRFLVNPEKDEGFKIPNKYSPHYARKWLADNPDRSDFFETRILKK